MRHEKAVVPSFGRVKRVVGKDVRKKEMKAKKGRGRKRSRKDVSTAFLLN